MDFCELSEKRFSVRKFTPDALSDAELSRILHAGHIAPTGCNNQPQRILVINSGRAVEKLRRCTKCHFGAKTALLVCYNEDECWHRPYDGAPSGPMDASIVATHMMLAAASIGVGSTWVMHFDPLKMREEFNIPENIIPVALLVLGHPAPDAEPFPGHSAFRDMNETVVYGSF